MPSASRAVVAAVTPSSSNCAARAVSSASDSRSRRLCSSTASSGRDIAGTHVTEIPRGDLESSHVALALVTEQRRFKAAETMALVVSVPEAPGVMEHVDVRHVRKWRRQPVQCVARLDEREIERLAVVGDDGVHVPATSLTASSSARSDAKLESRNWRT